MIRQLRSYDHATPPTLHDRICPDCSENISRRRSETTEPLAA